MRKLRAICRLPKRVLINILGNLLCTKHDRSQAIIWHSDFTNSWQRSNCSVASVNSLLHFRCNGELDIAGVSYCVGDVTQ